MRQLFFLMLFFPLLLPAQPIQDTLYIDGSNGVRPLVNALSEAFQKAYPDIRIEIGTGMNTSERINALNENKIDIAMASHGIDIPRFTRQGLQVHWFAKMAIVLGVHASVQVKNLATDELCQIYSGAIRNWSELGGHSLAIAALARPSNEVDTEVLMENLACFENIEQYSHLQFYEKSGPLAKALTETAGSIGMTAAVRVAQSNGQITPLKIDGVSPSNRNIAKGRYPFFRNAYLITKGTPTPAIKRFLQFIRSKTGNKVLKKNAAALAQ